MDQSDLMTGSEVRALLGGISKKTLGRYRLKYWEKGIHFIQPVHRIQYIRPMITDWMLHREEPALHHQAKEAWLERTQSPKRRRA